MGITKDLNDIPNNNNRQPLLIRRIIKSQSILAIALPLDNSDNYEDSVAHAHVALEQMKSILILDNTNRYCTNANLEK